MIKAASSIFRDSEPLAFGPTKINFTAFTHAFFIAFTHAVLHSTMHSLLHSPMQSCIQPCILYSTGFWGEGTSSIHPCYKARAAPARPLGGNEQLGGGGGESQRDPHVGNAQMGGGGSTCHGDPHCGTCQGDPHCGRRPPPCGFSCSLFIWWSNKHGLQDMMHSHMHKFIAFTHASLRA